MEPSRRPASELCSCGKRFFIRSTTVDDVRAGLPLDVDDHRGLVFIQAACFTFSASSITAATSQPHAPIHKQAVALILQRHARRVLGRNVSPHVWRHSCATHLVANGANILYVQRLLGHKRLKTTEIYTRVTMSDLKKTLRRTHPRARRASLLPPGLTREDAVQMPGGHDRWQR